MQRERPDQDNDGEYNDVRDILDDILHQRTEVVKIEEIHSGKDCNQADEQADDDIEDLTDGNSRPGKRLYKGGILEQTVNVQCIQDSSSRHPMTRIRIAPITTGRIEAIPSYHFVTRLLTTSAIEYHKPCYFLSD